MYVPLCMCLGEPVQDEHIVLQASQQEVGHIYMYS